ncbi:MAG: carboxypeptidase-like regulatory domain-containing protein [Armatimonadota bacterium]|nr:carboxypeptidase-like regulatory domain-containing protein [Armatimonadota bacterium]
MRKSIMLLAVAVAGGIAVWAAFAFAPRAAAANDVAFAGRVLSTYGKPIEGVEVSAYVRDRKWPRSSLKSVGESKTNKLGQFRISNLPASSVFTIMVKARGYERQRLTAIGCRYLVMRLRPATGSISGHVVDQEDRPVQGVWVKVGVGPDPLWTCRTDAGGAFEFADLVPGKRITIAVGGDRYTKDATVGAKDVRIVVQPDRVRDYKP